ncbi:putative toxin biosynthesis cytochrome P450 monooxygenase [Pseudovirgaria hyperparasitica]|uniref:Putative toxin biosynthesis cytochrome P450 monooxygenase n=1 Tax=Pseudovirgaria hyperparasitica TaxID=470096 RepID=A0A6A6WCV5_9PEZI|nr:putative toxin biosynthesis cytochrome P450 monooxygenase [Pseudovirgaria hyperparasitica]KAF2759884.1 putative toxin biosynthesis cytochrome P450 monooxygenase [Pseudovirgaria hyperparasitica]
MSASSFAPDFIQTWPSAILILCGVSLSYLIYSIVYNRYFHPLAKYPGPWLWTISRAPFAISLARGDLVHDTHRYHQKYGPIVRLAPNELSFIKAAAWKDIYSHRVGVPEFTKNPIWTEKTPNGVFSVINADLDDHTRQRKILNHAFSPTALLAQEDLIQRYVTLLIDKIRTQDVTNITDWITYCTFDIVGDLMFGKPFGCIEEEKYHYWVSYLFSNLKAACIMSAVKFYPSLFWLLIKMVPKRAFKERDAHFDLSVQWVRERVATRTERPDFLKYILDSNEKAAQPMSMPEIEASSTVLVLAGSETTATQLLGTFTHLLQHPSKLAKLSGEIRSRFRTEKEITLKAVDELEYMRAVLTENSRMAPSVPGQVPRIVPAHGNIINGITIPPGTYVGVPQLPAYRSPLNFAHPEHFIPERWLSAESPLFTCDSSDPEFTASTFENDEKAVLQPFSVGPRNCIGRFLANSEMRLILARLLFVFDPEMPSRDLDKGRLRETIERKWDSQRTYALWERNERFVKFVERQVEV